MKMKKIRSFSRSPMGTTFLFMLAILFLMTGTIGGVRAAPQIYNENSGYGGVQLDTIGVSLYENDKLVGSRNYERDYSNDSTAKADFVEGGSHVLLSNMLGDENKIQLGRKYTEKLHVVNSGNIPEYVRVTIYKYWTDSAGNKVAATDRLSPDLIDLHLLVNNNNGWVMDTEDKETNTRERTVLYYTSLLGIGNPTPYFTDTLKIDERIIDLVDIKTSTTTGDGNKIVETVTWLAEDGYQFWIEVEVDAVQNHNAEDAVRSAWGLQASDSMYKAIFGS
ncbi:MAG: hypothetical protein IJV30_08820 [Oscillospiraceae bacterium]|nr:hypothetical protein [Oscillospiraceae bacterium]